jgi:hypothetical protein
MSCRLAVTVFDLFPRPTFPKVGMPAFSLKNRNARCSAQTCFINGDIRHRQLRIASSSAARARWRKLKQARSANYVPYTHHTGRVLESLAEHKPKTLATMHGSTYYGDGAQALRDLATVMHVLGPKAQEGETTPIGTTET